MNALTLVHQTVAKYVKEGDFCIDATAGRGYDTAYLCSLVKDTGRVLAFDVQAEALTSTKELLNQKGLKAELVLDGHQNMLEYAAPDSAACVMFNLGYLPRGNHAVNTRAETSIAAITAALDVVKKGGLVAVSIYYGGDSGYDEHDALLEWLKTLDDTKYQVLATFFYNWKKDPPIPVFIIKN